MKTSTNIKKIKLILIHILIGTGIFYFLIHPFTMVVYWFEFSKNSFSVELFREILQKRLLESFTFNMAGMGGLFSILGASLGLLSGIFWISFIKKKNLVKKQEHLMKRDVLKLIELGEHNWVEFKSSIKYDYFKKGANKDLEAVIAKTIVGFMNVDGGKLIIGVDDDGVILGLEKDYNTLKHKNRDGYEREIFRIVSTYIDHEACFSNHVSFYQINGKDICLVDVESSPNPVYVNDGIKTTFYVRTGNATYPLSVKETVNYLKIQKI
ncbi:AlbA family DNA-binding domain-containing protein [Algibacter luteus]|uniref:AlbA family DNA-binding domain-containing protein n=1 Tax=Algibacter luteus TaxID=1178825 RepID=UPI00259A413E|nr:ATP-binding protein [Algibacter luteus]WJJ96439.1 ATP-binding protein [Algibacter luteus]